MHSMIQFVPLNVKLKFYRNRYLLKGFKMMLTINPKLSYPMVICCWFMSISLRAIEMISKIKYKAPAFEIKAFCSLHYVVTSKVQQAR